MADDDSRFKDSKTAKGLRGAGKSLMQSGQDELDRSASRTINAVPYRKGGKVRKASKSRMRTRK